MTQTIRSLFSHRQRIIAITLCVASAGLLVTPNSASAFDSGRSCACSNLEACPGMFERMCCVWNDGPAQCACSYWITNCVEDQ